MSKQTIMITVASLSAAGASVLGGAVVSSNATASSTTPDKATITVVMKGEGDAQPIICTYDGIPFVKAQQAGAVGLPGEMSKQTAMAGAARVTSGEPTLDQIRKGGLVVTGGALSPPGDGSATLPGKVGTAGMISRTDARPGTPDECVALRPPKILAEPVSTGS